MANVRLREMTREHVIAAARDCKPKRIQKWSCIVRFDGDKREVPVKQICMEAANLVPSAAPLVTPADFIAHYAVTKLQKLGFETRYKGDNDMQVSSVPGRIMAFLQSQDKRPFCDDCIANSVGINRHMAHQATLPFGLTSDFDRRQGQCDTCGQWKLVIAIAVG